ncbi:uncharacterized protein LOC100184557 [Ciona intestinalis]
MFMRRMRCTRSQKSLLSWVVTLLFTSYICFNVYSSYSVSVSENTNNYNQRKVLEKWRKRPLLYKEGATMKKSSHLEQGVVSKIYNGQHKNLLQKEMDDEQAKVLRTNKLDEWDEEEWQTVENVPVTNINTNTLKPTTLDIGESVYEEKEIVSILQNLRGGSTKSPISDFQKIRVKVTDELGEHFLRFNDYKKWKFEKFVKEIANPVPKSEQPPQIFPYDNDIPRPNPQMLIKDMSIVIDDVGISTETRNDRLRRLALGDEDTNKLPDVQAIIQQSTTSQLKIPNIIHFIWFGCRRFKVHNYISIFSAYEYQEPDLILFHTNCEPNGTYWEALKQTIDSKLKIVKRSPPTTIWGHPVQKVEHQSDVARLEILLETGGIYMDDDVVVLKSLDSLRNNEMVLGEENYDALANSIIMASPNSWFLKKWFTYYKDFNDTKWSESSCFVPWSLWHLFPSTINVVKERMLRPNWEEIKFLYHELWDWRDNYTVHLYSRFMINVDGTPERSLQELSVLNTTYGEIARYVLWKDPKIRDITEWMV